MIGIIRLKFFRKVRLAVLLSAIAVTATFSQVVPFVVDGIIDANNLQAVFSDSSVTEPQLICAFKVSNPDTIPFYLWVSFKEGGRMVHTSHRDETAPLRLVDLELRYRDNQHVPVVKAFPDNDYGPRLKKRVGGSWAGGGWVRKKRTARAPEERVSHRADRDRGVYEIPFWPEDAQGYYEMEIWGAMSAGDLNGSIFAGRYSETVSLEFEAIPMSETRFSR